jgi:hypothetical protein
MTDATGQFRAVITGLAAAAAVCYLAVAAVRSPVVSSSASAGQTAAATTPVAVHVLAGPASTLTDGPPWG